MSVTCSKCGGSRFELGSVTAADTGRTFSVLHCTSCGHALGLSEIDAVRDVLREQQSSLNELRHQLNEVREKLAKLTNPS